MTIELKNKMQDVKLKCKNEKYNVSHPALAVAASACKVKNSCGM